MVAAPDHVLGAHHWEEGKPVLVLLGPHLPVATALALAAAMRTRPASTDPFVILVEGEVGAGLRERALPIGVDEVLPGPLWPAELGARLRLAQRWRELRDSLSGAVNELARLRRALDPRRAEVVALLLRLLDTRLPGASARGGQAADLAVKIAGRFGVPSELVRDLELAARLHEVGRLTLESAFEEGEVAEPWQYVLGSRAVLAELTGLQGAAELIGAIYENWDGSGFPDHLQQGQIPLRCRVLRAVLDFRSGIRFQSVSDALAALSERAATIYDPLVLVHLTAVVEGEREGQPAARSVTVTDLREGMILAEDLYTEGGIKLLSRGSEITGPMLETIRRRHRFEPILRLVAIPGAG
jgi:response regulator RpfG family c-di-GMP phosphodiesterase